MSETNETNNTPRSPTTRSSARAFADKNAETAASIKSPRRRAREFALQGLYEWRVSGNDEAAIAAYLQNLSEDGGEDVNDFDKADRQFFVGLLRGVLAQRQALQEQLQPSLDRPFGELSPVEACVLLAGTFELVNYPKTPYRVIINESIELAKEYGGTDGHKYINGVLDKLANRLRPAEVEAKRRARANP
jgi:N utilization substance protein B